MSRIEGGAARSDLACYPEPEAPAPTRTHEVKRGDTLSRIADQLRAEGHPGTRKEIVERLLTLNPEITNKNLIEVGQRIRLPGDAQAANSGGNSIEAHGERLYTPGPVPQPPPANAGPSVSAGLLALMGPHTGNVFARPTGATFPTSPDGTPIYNQGDKAWGNNSLGTDERTISSKGCAMTSTAMVLSKLTGRAITPAVLDKYLDENGGYQGNNIVWSKAAECAGRGVKATRAEWDMDTINNELAAGRGVVVGVHYKNGTSETATDHWLAVTRRDPQETNVYWANDPAGGQEIKLELNDGRLVAMGEGARPYKTTGRLITFAAEDRS